MTEIPVKAITAITTMAHASGLSITSVKVDKKGTHAELTDGDTWVNITISVTYG